MLLFQGPEGAGLPQCLLTPTSITFINDDCKATVWGQPHALDVVFGGQRQCVGSVAEKHKNPVHSWSLHSDREGGARDGLAIGSLMSEPVP